MHDISPDKHSRVLISDYDGTMTRLDFFDGVLARVARELLPDYWGEYVAGKRTHFDALRSIYSHLNSHLRGGEETALALAREADLDPQLAPAIQTLSEAGWEIIVVSAGSAWYIERLLNEQNIDLTIISNPGRIAPDGSLEMPPPTDSPSTPPNVGVDKVAVVRKALACFEDVAYAGDGHPDELPARLVAPGRRFARGWLAEHFAAEGTPFRRFERWSEIAGILAGEQAIRKLIVRSELYERVGGQETQP